MTFEIKNIIKLLASKRFTLENEAALQIEIHKTLEAAGLNFIREIWLSDKSRIDLFYQGIGLEVKIKGTAKSIYKQCERYCQSDRIQALILVTSKSMGFPDQIHGKPCYFVNLGRGWL